MKALFFTLLVFAAAFLSYDYFVGTSGDKGRFQRTKQGCRSACSNANGDPCCARSCASQNHSGDSHA